MPGLRAAGSDTGRLANVRPDGLDRTLSRAVAPYRDTALSVLGLGDTTQQWLSHFPNATVHTFVPKPRPVDIPHVRVMVHRADPSEPSALHKAAFYGAPFDVIVDDGSRPARARLVSLLYLWEALRVGGVYVIEAPGVLGGLLGAGEDYAVLHKG